MLSTLDISRRKAVVAAGAGLLAIGAVALAWGNASAAPTAFAPASSNEVAGDISGPCDEAENAAKPECAGAQPASPAAGPAAVPTADPGADPGADGQTPADSVPGPSSGPAPASGEVRRFDAAGAGSVTYIVDGGTLTLVDAAAAPGWRVEIEQASGRELDLDFRAGTRRVQVDVEFEDGSVRERVRFRDDATDERTEAVDGVVAGTDDDRSGPSGNDDAADAPDDSDDRRGPSDSDDVADAPDDSDDRRGPSGDDDSDDDSDDAPDDSDDRGDRSGSDDH